MKYLNYRKKNKVSFILILLVCICIYVSVYVHLHADTNWGQKALDALVIE